jgi:hypothetical protein
VLTLVSSLVACAPEPEGNSPDPLRQAPELEEMAAPTIDFVEVCEDCEFTVDWTSMLTWPDGTPYGQTQLQGLFFVGYELGPDELPTALAAGNAKVPGAGPWPVEDDIGTFVFPAEEWSVLTDMFPTFRITLESRAQEHVDVRYLTSTETGVDTLAFE